MNTLLFLLQKEFLQIFRNKVMLRIIIALPLIQLIILPQAADFEIKNIMIAVVDHDHSIYSQHLVKKITASGYFKLTSMSESYPSAFEEIESDKADLILEIPNGFERNLSRENVQSLFVVVNAINGVKANVGGAYLGRIISEFNQEIRLDWVVPQRVNAFPTIDVRTQNWFNPDMNYDLFMVPGILVFLVSMVGTYMCALNIVKEKEVGTIEQINVTPIRKYQFILGKLIPFLVIGIFVFSVGLFAVARIMYGITPLGSYVLIYSYLFVFLIAVLGVGLLISTYSATQQQAMSLAFFFLMIFILMGGLFTSIDSMPEWAKWITYLNPLAYFIDVMRLVVMKGSGFAQIQYHFYVMIGFAVVLNTWAVLNYKKTS